MDEFEKEDKNWARKVAKNITDSSWSGDDRTVVQLMIYKQLKRIGDLLAYKLLLKGHKSKKILR